MSPLIPTNPLDLPVTERLLAQRISTGEITQQDVDLLRKGYRGMATTTFLGSLVGIPVFIVLGRRKPPPYLVTRLLIASAMSSSGAFLGFTIGGAAAAMEVNTHMQDSQRKLKVFEEIMITSKRAAEAQRLAGRSGFPSTEDPLGSPDTLESGVGKDAVWDTEAEERRVESERERSLRDTDAGAGSTITRETGSTWDRLRQQSTPQSTPKATTQPPQPSYKRNQQQQQQPIDITTLPNQRPLNPLEMNTTTQSKYAPGLSVEEKIEQESAEERRREQQEFERLLERERSVAAEGKETGFETGKW